MSKVYATGLVEYGYGKSPVKVTRVHPKSPYGNGQFLAGDDYYNLDNGRIAWAPWVCELTLTAATAEFKALVRNTQGCPRWLAHVDSLPEMT
jgi:hypothetical protein